MAFVQLSSISDTHPSNMGTPPDSRSDNVTFSSATTAGNVIIGIVSVYGYRLDVTDDAPYVTWSAVGTYDTATMHTQVENFDGGNASQQLYVFYKNNITGGDTTFAITLDVATDGAAATSIYWSAVLAEYDGVVSDPEDDVVTGSAITTYTVSTSSALTPTVSPSTCIILAGGDKDGGVAEAKTISGETGFTERTDYYNPTTSGEWLLVADKLLSSTATVNPTVSKDTDTTTDTGYSIFVINLENSASGPDINYNYVLQIT